MKIREPEGHRYYLNNIETSGGTTIKESLYKERKGVADQIKQSRNKIRYHNQEAEKNINKLKSFFKENTGSKKHQKEAEKERRDLKWFFPREKENLIGKEKDKINKALKETVEKPLDNFDKIVSKDGKIVSRKEDLDQNYYKEIYDSFSYNNFNIAFQMNRTQIPKKTQFFLEAETSNGVFVSYIPYRNNLKDEIMDILEKDPKKYLEPRKPKNQVANIVPIKISNSLAKRKNEDGKEDRNLTEFLESFYETGLLEPSMPDQLEIFDYFINSSSYVRKNLESRLESDLIDLKHPKISNFLGEIGKSSYKKYSPFAETVKETLDNYLFRNFGVYYEEFMPKGKVDESMEEFFQRQDLEINIGMENNIKSMRILEKEREGSVKKLLRNYGIKEFYRYPQEILVDQIDNENYVGPYGAIFYPREDSRNDFDNDMEVLRSIYNQSKENYALRIYEASTKRALMRKLMKSNEAYGKENMKFGVMAAHGTDQGIYPGGLDRYSSIMNNQLKGDEIKKKLGKHLNTNMYLGFFSCYTGVQNAMAQEISKMGMNVIGPNEETRPEDVDLKISQQEYPELKIHYDNRANSMHYYNGELVDKY